MSSDSLAEGIEELQPSELGTKVFSAVGSGLIRGPHSPPEYASGGGLLGLSTQAPPPLNHGGNPP